MAKATKCKYCESVDIVKRGKRNFPACLEHFEMYKKEVNEKKKSTTLSNYGVENPSQSKSILNKKRNTFLKKYGVSHPSKSDVIKDKKKQTSLKRYGVENVLMAKEVRESIKKTNLEKYGVECNLSSKEVRESIKKTNLEKYGVECTFQSDEIKKKIKQTNIDKYGVEHPMQFDPIKQKVIKTNIEKYGVDITLKIPEIQEEIKKNNLKKYGYEHHFLSPEIQEEIKKNNLKKYGYEYPIKNKKIKMKAIGTHKQSYWDTYVSNLKNKKIIPLFDKEYYLDNDSNFKFKCERCGNEFISDNISTQKINCGCLKFKSHYEDEIYNWLMIVNKDLLIKRNERKLIDSNPYLELDIYLPDYNLGIDFHGLYWHSDLHKDKNYHQEKWKLFKEININIIQIFENEWINKENIVKSIILSKMNIFNNRIYARETIVKEINNDDYRLFLEENHIQGPINSSIRLGLYFNNELVSVLGVGKSRFKKDEIELHRFCNKLNTQVVGGFSKLLSYYKNNNKFNNLISYTDLRYFDGSGYIKNGFEIDSITNPNYFYFKIADNSNIYSRIEFQKHKLKDKLDVFDPEKTEYENMLNNDYNRIFDAGNYKLIMREN